MVNFEKKNDFLVRAKFCLNVILSECCMFVGLLAQKNNHIQLVSGVFIIKQTNPVIRYGAAKKVLKYISQVFELCEMVCFM